MKILFALHQFFPRHYTGTETFVLNLSRQMQRMGHQVKVLTYATFEGDDLRPYKDMLLGEYSYQGVPVISIGHKEPPEDRDFRMFDRTMENAIGGILDREAFDLVHVCHPMRVGSVVKAAKKRKIPIVLTLTDFWLLCPKAVAITPKNELCNGPRGGTKCAKKCFGEAKKHILQERFKEIDEVLKGADCIVSPTKFLMRVFQDNGYSGIKVIPFGQDYSDVRPYDRVYDKDSKLTLGFMSTLLPHKGAHIFIEALNKAGMSNISAKIYGGSFSKEEYYNSLVGSVKNREQVQFLGEYDKEDMPEILQDLDALVLPSTWWENSPLVLLKALSHNVPVIASNLGGMTEIVKDKENGFTFESGSSDSLAEVIRRIGSDPGILNGIRAGIRHPPRIEEEAFHYERIYSAFISRPAQKTSQASSVRCVT